MSFEAFKGCQFPPLDWAVSSAGRSGAFWPRDANVAGGYLFVVGDFRSIDDSKESSENNYFLTGPYTKNDKGGINNKAISETVLYQEAGSGEGRVHDYEIGIQVIDAESGTPLDILHFKSFHTENTFSVGAAPVGDDIHVSVGGTFTGSASFPETKTCKDMQNGDATVTCKELQTVPENDPYQFSTELAYNTIDPGDIPDTIPSDTNGFTSYLMGLQVNGRNPKASDWNNLLVKWATIPWHGSYTARVHGTIVDSRNGNVIAGGEACNGDNADDMSCDGYIGTFAEADGTKLWTRKFESYDKIYRVELDVEHDLIFYTGHKGDDLATGCISATDGKIIWERFIGGSENGLANPASNTFTGEVKLAKEQDGPYVYAVHQIKAGQGGSSLDSGTSYAACLDESTNNKFPSYEIVPDKLLTEEDCTSQGYTFISSDSSDAFATESAETRTGIICKRTTGGVMGSTSCIVKYHKFTGHPIWSTSDVVHPRGMETSPDGPLITGPYKSFRGNFGGDTAVNLPDTGFNTIYQALLDKDSGDGIYVQTYFDKDADTHPNASAQDENGNMFIISRSFAENIYVGTEDYTLNFPTTVDDDSHYHLLVLKVLTGSKDSSIVPDCLICPTSTGVRLGIKDNTCYIDQVCYNDGYLGALVTGEESLICDSSYSQTEFKNFGETEEECNVCGKDKVMTKRDAYFDASIFTFGELQCGMIDNMAKSGTLPKVNGLTCNGISYLLSDDCGCQPAAPPASSPTNSPITPPTAEPRQPSLRITPSPILINDNTGFLQEDNNDGGISMGALSGIIIGSVTGLFVIILGVFMIIRRRRRNSGGQHIAGKESITRASDPSVARNSTDNEDNSARNSQISDSQII